MDRHTSRWKHKWTDMKIDGRTDEWADGDGQKDSWKWDWQGNDRPIDSRIVKQTGG
jgi:hypothetical protein